MSNQYFKLSVLAILCSSSFSTFAARAVDLNHQDVSSLRSFIPATSSQFGLRTVTINDVQQNEQAKDFNQTLHVRLNQTYKGYPVWGADAVIHIPQGHPVSQNAAMMLSYAEKSRANMNGVFYDNLSEDLTQAPEFIFSQHQSDEAVKHAIANFEKQKGVHVEVSNKSAEPMVYIDDNNKAHWSYYVNFYVKSTKTTRPYNPNYIMDADNFSIFEDWDDIKNLEKVKAGGFGGNPKVGKYMYDGKPGNFPQLDILRDPVKKLCYLANEHVRVTDFGTEEVASFTCSRVNRKHANIYWDGQRDEVNQGYSPGNDALYFGQVVQDMYLDWYKIPVLVKNQKPMLLDIITHASFLLDDEGNFTRENAGWDTRGQKMYFGDGENFLYPLTSLDVTAHEVSHGFTNQHARLSGPGQPSGINESFSDMASRAAQVYVYGKNSWELAPEVVKMKGIPLRYLDHPTKDCYGRRPGMNCSIDHVRDYRASLDEHDSAGVYNRVFYLMATAPGWDTKKAFDVMVQANQFYWTRRTNFFRGACGVISATKDYKYDVSVVAKAFAAVGIDINKC